MAELRRPGQARRTFLVLAAGGLFALGGCQLVPAPRVETPPEPAQAPREEPRAEPVRPGLPADETRNRVAVLVPLSGPNAGVGQSIANAAQLALLDAGGDRIRITVYDTAKGGAAAAANEALGDGNGLFLGPLLAEDVRTAAAIARRNDVPVIAFSNDVSVAGDGVYLMGFTPGQSISRVVAYARTRGLDRFAAVAPSGTYGKRAAQALLDATQRGGTVTGIETYDRDAASLRAAVVRVGGQGPYDALLVADSGRNAAAAGSAARRGSRLLGTELWAAEAGLGRNAGLRGAWYAAASDAMFDQLRARYRARYGSNPYRLASLGYDAVLLAVRAAKEWRIGRAFPERALRDPGGFAGVDGPFRFGGSGIAERSLEVREVTAGGTTVLSPAPRNFD